MLQLPGRAARDSLRPVGEVSVAQVGRTSFSLAFAVRGPDGPVAEGRTVYVVVGTDGSGKRPIPGFLLAALGAEPPAV